MLPSFVSKPTGQGNLLLENFLLNFLFLEKGTFYALDLGGTNFRVIR